MSAGISFFRRFWISIILDGSAKVAIAFCNLLCLLLLSQFNLYFSNKFISPNRITFHSLEFRTKKNVECRYRILWRMNMMTHIYLKRIYICNQSRNVYIFKILMNSIFNLRWNLNILFCLEPMANHRQQGNASKMIVHNGNFYWKVLLFFINNNNCFEFYEHLNFSGGTSLIHGHFFCFHLIMRLFNLNKMNVSKHLLFRLEHWEFLCVFYSYFFLLNNLCPLSYLIHLCSLLLCVHSDTDAQSKHRKRKCIFNNRWILLNHLQMR